MKKNSFKLMMSLFICGLGIFVLSSCKTSFSDPIDVIKNQYGDTEFKISFSSEGLTESLSDVIYTANNIPKLPTPNKVGYRFAGWYFDEAYTKPYETDYLYTKMCNVTLYAKWEEEEFINNGIYEIEYAAKILDDTIVKGSLADQYGYLRFPDDIISDETYIEKNDNGVFLRIQYDMRYHCPTIDDNGNMGILTYTVSDPENRVSDTESIIDRTGTIQTIYYNLKGLNISDPIKLNVEFVNWNANLSNEDDRLKTKVGYTVEFNITRFIGYTTSYVDANDKLEDGYYLVKTHYSGLNKAATMLDVFNPVYSYLIAKDGHYKLVKQMNAYNSDIIGNLKDQDYIHVKTGYARDICYYTFNNKIVATDEMVDEDNYSLTDWCSFFKADKFGDLTYEFHADTGKYYYVFDLGDTADVDLLLVGASTGAMTEMFNMGPTYKRLVIDYSSMVKLSEIDYKPLEGDTTSTFDTEAFYFSTDVSSLTGNTIYNAEMNYDFANRLINTFYSSISGEDVNKLHSTRMVIKPTDSTNLKSIVDSKGEVFTFMATYDCYDYDEKIGYPLYGDYLEWQTFSSFSQRMYKRLEMGYETEEKEKINIYDLFRSKIYPNLDEGNLKYKAYGLKNNGEVDYSKEIDFTISNNVFTFNNDFAVYLEGTINNEVKKGTIVIRKQEDPTITVIDEYEHDEDNIETINWTYDEERDVYVSSKAYFKEDIVHIPTINYISYGIEYSSHNAYNSDNEVYHMNQEDFGIYSLVNGIYTKFSYNYENWNPSTFEMANDTMYVVYRLVDRYGYVKYLSFEYKGEEKGKYSVYCNEKEVVSGKLYYYYDGTRQKLNLKDTDALELTDVDDIYNETYTLKVTNDLFNLSSLSYVVYAKNDTYKGNNKEELKNILKNEKYAIVDFMYVFNDDVYTKSYVYGIKINGKKFSDYKIFDNDTVWFTNNSYKLENSIAMDNDGINFANSSIDIQKYVGTTLRKADLSEVKNDSNNYTFLKSGEYRIVYKFSFYNDENEEIIFKNYNIGSTYSVSYRYITVSKDITVYDINFDIKVTYVTDSNHHFKDDIAGVVTNGDGSQSYTVSFNQTQDCFAIGSTLFKDFESHLYKWAYKTKSGKLEEYISPDGALKNLGAKRNTTNPVLYAVWDEGVVVRAEYEYNGETKVINEKRYYKNTNRSYYLSLADFNFKVPKGYEHVGWECDKPIFYTTNSNSEKIYSYTTDSLFDVVFEITEDCVIRPILKGPLTIRYQTYSNGEYNDIKFPNTTITEGKTLKDTLNKTLLNSLHNTYETAEFKYWAIKLNGTLIKIDDIDNESIVKDYVENGYVTIVAVYEE